MIFVLNPTSIYAHLAESDKELYDVTGLLPCLPVPLVRLRDSLRADWVLFKHNPYPEVAKGLAEYWMAPENLRVMIEEGGGRWGPPYKGMYDSEFWKRPCSSIGVCMLERGASSPLPARATAAAGEVLATMYHRPV